MATSSFTKRLKIMGFLGLPFLFVGCKKGEVQGIQIGETLFAHQDLKENKEMVKAISQVLNGDEKGLSTLTNFDCGGGAGCYDLGFVLTQLVYEVGEAEFVEMAKQIEKDKLGLLAGLVRVGLEYGYNDKDGERDEEELDEALPQLAKFLTESSINY